jgi:hypothetical protein
MTTERFTNIGTSELADLRAALAAAEQRAEEAERNLAAIRAALHGYADSSLPSLAEWTYARAMRCDAAEQQRDGWHRKRDAVQRAVVVLAYARARLRYLYPSQRGSRGSWAAWAAGSGPVLAALGPRVERLCDGQERRP